MINFVSRGPRSIEKQIGLKNYQAYCGLLTSPRTAHRPERAIERGVKWIADNDCFLKYDPDSILRMLKAYQGLPGNLFVLLPDVWSNARETALLCGAWLNTYQQYGYKIAHALQDGVEQTRLAWDDIDAVFIGGTDEFKYSDVLRGYVHEAKRRGKWVHHGRVNSPERILYSRTIGCDSFDGTNFNRNPQDIVRLGKIAKSGQRCLFNDWEWVT